MVLNGAVVVTGAHGFAGRALTAHYEVAGREFRGLVRAHSGATSSRPGFVAVGDLARVDDARLARLLEGAGAVVHLAGRAHVMRETDPDPLRAYREANVVATARLARAAAAAGVARFVLASTVKVNGEQSPPDRPFRPDDPPSPQDAYARSKREAEAALSDAVAGSATAPIVLRLPLMYGPGVKGNFLALMQAVAHGRRLPVGAVTARRSLLYVGNLVHAVDAALDAPVAPAGIHFVADRGDADGGRARAGAGPGPRPAGAGGGGAAAAAAPGRDARRAPEHVRADRFPAAGRHRVVRASDRFRAAVHARRGPRGDRALVGRIARSRRPDTALTSLRAGRNASRVVCDPTRSAVWIGPRSFFGRFPCCVRCRAACA